MTSKNQARSALDDVAMLRARTRASTPSLSIAAIMAGLLAVGAMPFYVLQPLEQEWSQPSRFAALAGYSGVRNPELASLYWIVAVPFLYFVLAYYFNWIGERSGTKARTRTWLVVGLLLFVACVAVLYLPEWVMIPGNPTARGLTPLLPVAVALLLWGVGARDKGLTAVAAAGLAACLTAILYNTGNLLPAGSLDYQYRLMSNLALPACVYLVGGFLMTMATRRTRVTS